MDRLWLRALVMGSVGMLVPYGTARACDPCNPPAPDRVEFFTTDVASNGVLAFTLDEGQGRDISHAYPYLTITVRDALGAEISGGVEVHEKFEVAAWRPSEPWSIGATYEVAYELDFDAFALDHYDGHLFCPPVSGTRSFTIVEAIVAPVAFEVTTSALVEVRPTRDFADLVCCDDSYPDKVGQSESPGSCPEAHDELGPGTCSSLRGVVSSVITFTADIDGLDETTLANFAFAAKDPDLDRDFVATTRSTAPCVTAELLDLVTGEVQEIEGCVDPDDEPSLGEQPRDPTEDLLECEGPAYTCTVADEDAFNFGDWDRGDCRWWPSGEPVLPGEPEPGESTGGTGSVDGETTGVAPGETSGDDGCGCYAGDSDHAMREWFTCVVVLAAARRRGSRSTGRSCA